MRSEKHALNLNEHILKMRHLMWKYDESAKHMTAIGVLAII